MSQDQEKFIQKVINKEKWWEILSRLIEVLRINIFIVDVAGKIVLPPEDGKYGSGFLMDKSLGFDLMKDSVGFLSQFEDHGKYLESANRFDLRCIALPVQVNQITIAYLIIGPIVVNKLHDKDLYMKWAQECQVNPQDVWNEITTLRIVSYIMIKSIVDLLSEIIKNNVELGIKESSIDELNIPASKWTREIKSVAKEIYSTVQLDEVLVTFLDLALKMTEADSGSIMLKDETTKELALKVSRGLEHISSKNLKVKWGEGIAGLAAKENKILVLDDQTAAANNRIKRLLKRPQIKQSIVIPLHGRKRVMGVLNLSTQKPQVDMKKNLDNLKYLTELLSSTL